MFDPDDYRLEDGELAAIFEFSIVPALFGEAQQSDDPLAILVGGQPGAGKSRAGAAAVFDCQQPIVEIIGDDLRAYHPSYLALLALEPSAMPNATAQAAGAWVERCIQYAAQRRISVLVEGTFRDPDVATRTALQFRVRGYRIQVNLVAVAAPISHLAIADRFVTGILEQGHGRFTALAAHDNAMKSLPTTMKALQAAAMSWDEFVIRDRNTVLIRSTGKELDDIFARAVVTQREWRGESLGPEDCQAWIEREPRVTQYLQNHYPNDVAVQELTAQLRQDSADITNRLLIAHIERLQRSAKRFTPRTPIPWKKIETPALALNASIALDQWLCTENVHIDGAFWLHTIDPAAIQSLKADQRRRTSFVKELVCASWKRVFGHSHEPSGVRSQWAEQDQAVVLTPYLTREGKHIFASELARWLAGAGR